MTPFFRKNKNKAKQIQKETNTKKNIEVLFLTSSTDNACKSVPFHVETCTTGINLKNFYFYFFQNQIHIVLREAMLNQSHPPSLRHLSFIFGQTLIVGNLSEPGNNPSDKEISRMQ